MFPFLLVVVGGGVIAFGVSYFFALEAKKGYPYVGIGLSTVLAGMVISDSEWIIPFSMLVLLFLAPALSFPIHGFRTRKNKKR